MTDIRRMPLGQVVDFCIEFNKRLNPADKQAEKVTKRRATQADIDAFFG